MRAIILYWGLYACRVGYYVEFIELILVSINVYVTKFVGYYFSQEK